MRNFFKGKRNALPVFVTVIAIAVIALMLNHISERKKEAELLTVLAHDDTNQVSQSKQYEACREFVIHKLMNAQGGVYTNYVDAPSDTLTKGHDVLSESQGLIMSYAVQIRDKALFDTAWRFLKTELMTEQNLFSWRTSSINAASTASVDDLRIAGALYSGAAVFSDVNYRRAADKISKSLYKYCVKEEILTDGYDFMSNKSMNRAHLSYLDIFSMRKLAVYDRKWRKVYHKSLLLINEGRVAENMPLFRDQYDIESQSYQQTHKFDMLTSMLTLYYLCQTDNYKQQDIDWLKLQLANGSVFTKYDKDGIAASDMQSSAVYAIIMLIARRIGDDDLYQRCKSSLYQLQVMDPDSEIYGSFGNASNLEVYSFDNLLAMWALALDTP